MGNYNTPPSIVIMDIDGTLADITHRLHLIKPSLVDVQVNFKPDWKKFHSDSEIAKDTLIDPIYRLNQMIYFAGYEIHLTSGRMESSREKTINWLEDHGVFFHFLHMRKNKDYRADYVIKKEIHDAYFIDREILFAVDDRTQVVEMWRDLGIKTLQVEKGNF